MDVSGWYKPPRHVQKHEMDMPGWSKPPRHVKNDEMDVSGWSTPPRHVRKHEKDVFGWSKPPRHVRKNKKDMPRWSKPPRHIRLTRQEGGTFSTHRTSSSRHAERGKPSRRVERHAIDAPRRVSLSRRVCTSIPFHPEGETLSTC
jgi:hypothetical protein